jgi:DNA polymerase-3 subunit delta
MVSDKKKSGSSAGGLRPYYFLVGEEDYLHGQEIHKIARRLGVDAGSWENLEGEGATAARILEAVRTDQLDLFAAGEGSGRMVVVRGAEKIIPSEYALLKDFFSHPGTPPSCLIFSVRKPPKGWKAPPGVSSSAVISCSPYKAQPLRSWIHAEAARRSIALAPGAVEDLLDAAGVSMLALSTELDKFAAYRGGSGSLSAEEVRELTGRSGSADIYALSRHIVAGKEAAALALARRLLEDKEAPLKILGNLVGSFRRLWLGSEAFEKTRSTADACAAAGVNWYQDQFIEQVRRFHPSRVAEVFDRLFAASLAMKGEEKSPGLALERLVIDLAEILKSPRAPGRGEGMKNAQNLNRSRASSMPASD